MITFRTPGTFILLIALTTVAGCGGSRGAPHSPPQYGAAIDRVLAPQATPAFQSEVLVLATSHLSGFGDRLRPEHLEPLLARLEAFAPTRIAVEARTADEVALLAEREKDDPTAAELLNMFDRGALTAGQTMQQALGIGRVAAEQRVRAVLAMDYGLLTNEERLELVGYFLAAYESTSATLQWAYLPPEVRDQAESLPSDIQDMLDRRLQSANEIFTVALPLARRLGLQQIYSIDSQYDGIRILSVPREALSELLSDPARAQLRDQERARKAENVTEAAFAAGDLLPLYLYINGNEYQTGDVAQWNWLFQGRRANGLDRFRYALWELRNLRQAAHIIDAAASGKPERLLVIVGSSHKAYLEKVLGAQLSVRLVQLDELEPKLRDDRTPATR